MECRYTPAASLLLTHHFVDLRVPLPLSLSWPLLLAARAHIRCRAHTTPRPRPLVLLMARRALPSVAWQEMQPKIKRFRMKEVRMQSAPKFISDPTNLQQLAFGDHKVPPPRTDAAHAPQCRVVVLREETCGCDRAEPRLCATGT